MPMQARAIAAPRHDVITFNVNTICGDVDEAEAECQQKDCLCTLRLQAAWVQRQSTPACGTNVRNDSVSKGRRTVSWTIVVAISDL